MLTRMDANSKDEQEEMKEDLLARLEAKIEATHAKMDVKLEEMSEEIKSGQAEMRAKRTDPRRLWILEEVGCHLQEGVPSCSSGMAQGKSLQESSDPWKLWTMERIGCSQQGDEPLCRSGTTQGTWASETRKTRYGTENPERTDVQDETLEGPRMQNRNKGSRHKAAAAS
jgi:hypothetical protein